MKQIYILLLAIIFLSCSADEKNDEKNLIGKWNVDDARGNTIMLRADSTYYMVLGGSEIFTSVGNWSYNEKDRMVALNNLDDRQVGRFYHLYIYSMNADKMDANLALNLGENNQSLGHRFSFSKAQDVVSGKKNDYTTIEMNKWRVTAEKEETEEEILERVKSAFRFGIAYLTYHQDKQGVGTSELYPLPLTFAGNGIAVKKNSDWESIFYSDGYLGDEAAEISYSIINQAFYDCLNIEIPDEIKKNPIHLNLFLLENLYEKLQ